MTIFCELLIYCILINVLVELEIPSRVYLIQTQAGVIAICNDYPVIVIITVIG